MTPLRFVALDSATVAALRDGEPDANGQPAERHRSDGDGNPCRHCLADIAEGEEMLILAHRPFPALQPFAELGPVFLHAGACERYAREDELPPVLKRMPAVLLRGYGTDDRIVYGSGGVVPRERLESEAARLLARDDISYLHVRSARYNCYQCRIERG